MLSEELIELLVREASRRREYLGRLREYLLVIKDLVKQLDPEARVILFGSVARGEERPDSDVDIMIVTDLAKNVDSRIKLRVAIARKVGDEAPFEIHIVTHEEYRSWYRNFIKDGYIEVHDSNMKK
jgi:predicted nucleotidyltransferase